MTKLRAYATIFVLGIGAGMGVTFLTPQGADAPERINPAMLRNSAADVVTAGPNTTSPINPAAAETQTVTVPAAPLLRAATGTRPIDTTSPDVLPAAVRHEAPVLTSRAAGNLHHDQGSPAVAGGRPVPVTGISAAAISGRENLPEGDSRRLPASGGGSMLGAADGDPAAVPVDQSDTLATGAKRARPSRDGQKKLVKRPEPRAPTSKRVETLFLNPLGVR